MTEARPASVRGTLLVVDDTPDTLAVLTDALERDGYTVLIATSGAAALRICERITPELILMDAIMPGLDGFETCRRIKGAPATAPVPVIFMTALSETEHVVRGLAAGGVDYVTKPIVLDELFARIRVHMDNARAAHSARAALDAAGGFLLAFGRDGALIWTTPQAGEILAARIARDALAGAARSVAAIIADSRPPAALAVPMGGTGDVSLSYIGPGGRGEYLFRLAVQDRDDEVLARHFALTTREAEVLMWLARGKSNRDIGEILDVSPRTVNKHLEVVFRKLGVENRASAAVSASRVLARA